MFSVLEENLCISVTWSPKFLTCGGFPWEAPICPLPEFYVIQKIWYSDSVWTNILQKKKNSVVQGLSWAREKCLLKSYSPCFTNTKHSLWTSQNPATGHYPKLIKSSQPFSLKSTSIFSSHQKKSGIFPGHFRPSIKMQVINRCLRLEVEPNEHIS
jgi:hypothetical protein